MSDTRRAAPQQARARRTRTAIIEAASRRFGAEGYRSATIAAIAADAGVTDAGLVDHFPTKEDLLFAVMQAADAELGTMAEERSALGGLEYFRQMRDWGELMERDASITALHTILSAEHLLDDSRINAYFRERYQNAVAFTTRAGRPKNQCSRSAPCTPSSRSAPPPPSSLSTYQRCRNSGSRP